MGRMSPGTRGRGVLASRVDSLESRLTQLLEGLSGSLGSRHSQRPVPREDHSSGGSPVGNSAAQPIQAGDSGGIGIPSMASMPSDTQFTSSFGGTALSQGGHSGQSGTGISMYSGGGGGNPREVSPREGGSWGSRASHTSDLSGGVRQLRQTILKSPEIVVVQVGGFIITQGCSSVRTGFISRDEDAQVNYISSKQPYDREVYSMSRQACLRSLTGEVCPGKDGPIFFGNDQQGHVLSYTFHINDSQARGFSQRYSILVVMMDKIYLLNSWPFLVPHLKTVIEHITKKTHVVYEREKAKMPHPPPQASRWSKPARSLMDLTEDRNIFKTLHLSFVWILKACGNRITETLLEGPPTEDSIIDMEKQEETEEGFCLIFSKKVNVEEVEESAANKEDTSENLDVEEGEGPIISNIRQLMKILDEDKFHVLAHHVVIGNQIIVRSCLKSVVKSVLSVLKSLLPKGCCRVIPYSHVYEESWKCNFLGLAPEVDLPMHIMSDETFVLVEVSLDEPKPTDTQLEEDTDKLLKRLLFNLASPRKLPDKAPSALSKMELALQNQDLTDTVVEHYLICLKEEWMNKVKVRFKFTKAGGNRSEEDTNKLLQVIGAKEEDTPLLKFWMQGLSLQYRNHILTTSKSAR